MLLASYVYDMRRHPISSAVTVRISASAARRLRARASARGTTTSAIVRELLEHEAGPIAEEPSAFDLSARWVGAVRSKAVPAGRTARRALTDWHPDRRG